jgi:broad specificity phosphatase PhoE
MELYVARHGETLSNLEKRITGREGDSLLSEKGIEQAKSLGKFLENINFDAVYTSPLNRAVDTINIALGDKYEILIDDRLAEIGLGVMEGMTYDDVSVKFPESGMLFMFDPISYKPPLNGEHLTNMIKRIDSFLNDIIKMNYDKVFVLTHGYVLRVIYACTLDKSISAIAQSPFYANCELSHYIYDCGKWELA